MRHSSESQQRLFEIRRRNKIPRRTRQMLLTAAVGGALIVAPRVAIAASHTLSNADTVNTGAGISISDNDANVTTTDTGFHVNATIGDALNISGAGNISYDDLSHNNNLITTDASGNALSIISTGDIVSGNIGAVTVVSGGTISGGTTGISVENDGTGNIGITTTGTVTGTSTQGIFAYANNTAAGNITVQAADVSGGTNGVYVENKGLGTTSVTTTGLAHGTSTDGIYAYTNNALNTNDLTINAADASGGKFGIVASNTGTGKTSVTATGTVNGAANDGIHVLTNNANAGDTTVTATNNNAISGGTTGIFVENDGTGSIKITTNGSVTGTSTQGIYAYANNSAAGNITVQAVGASGGTNGVYLQNKGLGTTSVTTTGLAHGTSTDGIYAYTNNALNTKDLTINAVDTSGGKFGIVASNNGLGNTSVTSTGTAIGTTIDGIYAVSSNNIGSGTLTVNAANVTGYSGGIYTENDGIGDTSVTTTGTVTATAGNGMDVYAYNNSGAGAGKLTVNVANVTASYDGIYAVNSGTGATSITTNGEVQGGNAGIQISAASTTNLTTVTVNNGSYVHNSSAIPANPATLAIQISGVSGGTAMINNSGNITGRLLLNAENDNFTNNSTWNSTGNSYFGSGIDTFTNNGIFIASNGTGTATTTVNGIETVNSNTGSSITMQDGQVGDTTTFTNGGTGVFKANGGILAVDTNIVPQESDTLHVDNVSGGTTGVDVNIVNGLGQPTTGDGIPIVIIDGTSSLNAFVLDHSITAGLYNYELNKVGDPTWNLQSAIRPEAVATGVLPILGSRTALSTLSNLHDRERDVEVLSDNANSKKGIWGRVFGQSNDFNANDSNDFGFDSRLYGVQAGLDLKASNDGNGNRKYAGLYVAYASASGNATQNGHNVASLDMNATTVGAYYTKYSSRNWYLDAVAQYSSLGGIKAKTGTDNISPSGKSYALSLEVGQQYHPDSSIIREVQAQLIDQYTDVDGVTLNDSTKLNLSSLNAVTGRVGLRLYGNPKSGKSFLPWLRANIWHTFSGDSTISSLGSSIETPIGGTSGELELGFTKGSANSGGWGIYGSAGYLFDISGAEFSGWKGTLGLRKGW